MKKVELYCCKNDNHQLILMTIDGPLYRDPDNGAMGQGYKCPKCNRVITVLINPNA